MLKRSTFVSTDIIHFATWFGVIKCMGLQNFLLLFLMKKGFRLVFLPYSPDMWRLWGIVFTCKEWAVLFRYSCRLLAVSLISFLLVLLSVLEGHPVLSNATAVCHFFPLVDHSLHCVPLPVMFWKFFCTHVPLTVKSLSCLVKLFESVGTKMMSKKILLILCLGLITITSLMTSRWWF